VIAISTDDMETSKRFRDSLKAPYHFVADEKAVVVKAFDVKVFIFTLARRVTFVVGPGRKILSVSEGSDAIEPSGAVAACSIKPPEALKFVTGSGGAAAPFEPKLDSNPDAGDPKK
jgi:thioredoxin-dependent peroxiredoxin